MGSTEVTEADEKILTFLVGTKSLLLHEKEKYINYVVVLFYPWFKFYFLLFLGMAINV